MQFWQTESSQTLKKSQISHQWQSSSRSGSNLQPIAPPGGRGQKYVRRYDLQVKMLGSKGMDACLFGKFAHTHCLSNTVATPTFVWREERDRQTQRERERKKAVFRQSYRQFASRSVLALPIPKNERRQRANLTSLPLSLSEIKKKGNEMNTTREK